MACLELILLRGENQKWPTSGQSGYVTPAVSGIPTAAERGGGIRSGPLVGKVATSPLPSRGSPPLQSGGKSEVAHLWAKWLRHPCRLGDPPLQSGGWNQKWPTCGRSGYVTPAVSGIPTASERGANQKWPTCGQSGYVTPAVSGIPRCRAEGGIRSGPLVGEVATSPLPSRGSPPLQSGGQIRSGPLVGKVATSPLPSRGSPPLQSGGQNQKWPTSGQGGYVTPAVSGIPTAADFFSTKFFT